MRSPLLGSVGRRCFYRDCSPGRPRAGLGSFPRSGDAEDEQTGQRVSGSRAGLPFECSALVLVREPNHFALSLLAKYGTILGLFIMAGIFSVLAPETHFPHLAIFLTCQIKLAIGGADTRIIY